MIIRISLIAMVYLLATISTPLYSSKPMPNYKEEPYSESFYFTIHAIGPQHAIEQSRISTEQFAQYFRQEYGCDVTQTNSYKHIENNLYDEQTKKSHPINMLFGAITGPFAPALVKEAELQKARYHTFYHGVTQKWGFLQDFTAALINELARHSLCRPLRSDFLYLQDSHECYNLKNPHNFLGNKLRVRKDSLCTHAALLGGTYTSSNSSWFVALANYESVTFPLDLYRNIFQAFNITRFADKYEKKVYKLYDELTSIKKGGRLMQIAIPADEPLADIQSYYGAYPHYDGSDEAIAYIKMDLTYLLNQDSSVKIFAYDAYSDKNNAQYSAWIAKRNQLIAELVDDLVENRKYVDQLVATADKGTKYERAQTLWNLIKEAHLSDYALVQFFKLRHGCDITNTRRYAQIQESVLGFRPDTDTPLIHPVKTSKQIKEGLTAVINGPLTQALIKEAELGNSKIKSD